MFNGLTEKDLSIIIGAFQMAKFDEDTMVITEGEEGNSLFIVDNGKLECSKLGKGVLKTYTSGDVFGELALLYNVKRQASIRALEKSTCWVLDRETFVNIIKDSAVAQREKYEKILKNVEILETLNEYEIGRLADVLNRRKYDKGDYIVKEGDTGKEFYILESGKASAIKGTKVSMTYKEYDYFGELALLTNKPRAASVVADVVI